MTLRAILSRIRGSFASPRSGEDEAEIQAHLAMLAERFERQGMSPEEAAFAAKRQFGGVTQTKENLRERRALLHFDVWPRDLKYAFRQIKRAPGFTSLAALTLALGIGATTAVFAVVYAVLLNPLPYAQSERLVSVKMRTTHGHPESISYPNFFDLRARNRVFEGMVSYRYVQFTLSDIQPAVRVGAEIVSRNLFPLLGIHPALGRGFLPTEERAGIHVAVLSHRLWETRYSGSKSIVGRSIHINGELFTIVGVAPPGFCFPAQNRNVQLWTNFSIDADTGDAPPLTHQRDAGVLGVLARLRAGVTIPQAQAQMDFIARALAKEYPEDNLGIAGAYVSSALSTLAGRMRKPILILFGAVGLLLLIACANVANLLLVRSAERGREFALRAALGASRLALIRHLLVESLVLGLLGSGGGVLLAVVALHTVLPFAGTSIPRIMQAGLNGYVLGFCMVLAVVTTVLFSLAPAIHIARSDLTGPLKAGARTIDRGQDRLQGVLVVAQISLGLVLLTGAGMLIASFVRLTQQNPGFEPDRLLTFKVSLQGKYDAAKDIAFSDRLLPQLAAIPGVLKAATAMPLPLRGNRMSVPFDIEERPVPESQRPRSDMTIVTPGYFSTMGIPILKGRGFTERDDANSPPVVLVNRAFADKYFPGENVIGKRIKPRIMSGGAMIKREIIGVVGNAKQSPLNPEADPIYYSPFKQLPWGIGTAVLRTSVPPLNVESAVRAVVSKMGKAIPVYHVRTMDQVASTVIAGPRFQTLLMSSFSAIALLLTAVELYGVLAYSVTRRRRELGIRIALGAERTNVVGLVMKQAMLLVVIGIGIGIAGAVASDRLLRNMIYGTSPNSSLLLGIACAVLLVTGLLAAFVPARRAASVDPMEALRSE